MYSVICIINNCSQNSNTIIANNKYWSRPLVLNRWKLTTNNIIAFELCVQIVFTELYFKGCTFYCYFVHHKLNVRFTKKSGEQYEFLFVGLLGIPSQYLLQGSMQPMSSSNCQQLVQQLTGAPWNVTAADFNDFFCAGNNPANGGSEVCKVFYEENRNKGLMKKLLFNLIIASQYTEAAIITHIFASTTIIPRLHCLQ